MATTSETLGITRTDDDVPTTSEPYVYDNTRSGFDLIYRQSALQYYIAQVELDIKGIEENGNLSDTERMFAMQAAMNTWSAATNLRTNMLKSVSDSLKTIARNVN